jgi:serine/threonine protein kinase
MGSALGHPAGVDLHTKQQRKHNFYPELPFGLKSIDDTFFSNYCFASPLEVLGEGGDAKVLKGHKRSTGEAFALKCVPAKDVNKGESDIVRESEILMALSHEHIIKCYDFYDDTENGWVWMILELVPGGEFFDRIRAKTVYSENDARSSCIVILDILIYMHDREIAQ